MQTKTKNTYSENFLNNQNYILWTNKKRTLLTRYYFEFIFLKLKKKIIYSRLFFDVFFWEAFSILFLTTLVYYIFCFLLLIFVLQINLQINLQYYLFNFDLLNALIFFIIWILVFSFSYSTGRFKFLNMQIKDKISKIKIVYDSKIWFFIYKFLFYKFISLSFKKYLITINKINNYLYEDFWNLNNDWAENEFYEIKLK